MVSRNHSSEIILYPTKVDRFFPVRIVHVIIDCFTAVGSRLTTGTIGNLVESSPQGLENFAIDHPCPRYEGGCKPGITVMYVPMNMEKTNGPQNLYCLGRCQMRVTFEAPFEIFPILTHKVI